MARALIGLDIGTNAVRAVELVAGGEAPVVKRMAQVGLSPGAVSHGEVIDVGEVTSALRRLWKEGGFSARDVVMGVANQRVVVRQAELTRMGEEDLRSSLEFQVQELIPMPVDEAAMDLRILDPETGTDDAPTMQVLLVAAQQDMLDAALAAVTGAGLRPSLIDAGPFALMRALASDPVPGAEATAEVIVSVGAGITTVVVVEDGIPEFVRILTSGGADVTYAIVDDLSVPFEEAEGLKRRGPVDGDDQATRAAEVVDHNVSRLIDEIRGSIDFHLAQAPNVRLSRIALTGGGAGLDDLPDRLAEVMSLPVIRESAFSRVVMGRTGFDAEQIREAEGVMATAVGYALAALPTINGERRITLLPASVESARTERRQTALLAGGMGAFVVLLMALWLLRGGALSDARDDADAEEARTAQLQAQIAELSDVEELEALAAQRRRLIEGALSNDVAWTRLLQEVATVIPNDAWLTSFNGTAEGPLSFAGQGLDHTSSARWLLRAAEIASINGLWLPSSATAGESGGLVTFSTTAALTELAQSTRLEQFLDPGGEP